MAVERDNPEEEDSKKTFRALDEGDIALLKTYVSYADSGMLLYVGLQFILLAPNVPLGCWPIQQEHQSGGRRH